MTDETTPTQGEVAPRTSDAPEANVARLAGMLQNATKERNNAEAQLKLLREQYAGMTAERDAVAVDQWLEAGAP